MDLITPESGLIIWQLIIFTIVLLILRKFAWKPILSALRAREDSISEALQSAEVARIEMESLKADNEKLLREAKAERDNILKDASKVANEIKETAKAEAQTISDKMVDDAKSSIEAEKKAALKEIKDQVAELSLQITEKVLRKELDNDKAQKGLIQDYMKDLGVN